MAKVAILGFGTVGSGVYEVIKNTPSITARTGESVEVKYILDIRDFSDHPDAKLFTKNFDDILADGEVSVVAEVIGGVNPAYNFTKSALMAGKSVVTSNKELVATHGAELLKIAKENGVHYLFEASVGGGIPLIRPMQHCLAGNDITKIMGIVNGTTNYILTKMIKEGSSFAATLAKAQELGYAESNPAADIEGIDACRKIAILSSMVSGREVNPDEISTEGITNIDLYDVQYANALDCSLKLIAYADIDGEKVFARVSPMLIPVSHPLSSVEGVFNAAYLTGSSVGDVMLYGSGAGKLPTASAVVGDIIEIVRGISENARTMWVASSGNITPIEETSSSALIRAKADFEIEGARRIDVGIEGEAGFLLDNASEATLAALSRRDGFIKLIRRMEV